MPENQPPESDPFADLYGRLPDPRTGSRADDAPSSRRAAREARRAESTPAEGAAPGAEHAQATAPGTERTRTAQSAAERTQAAQTAPGDASTVAAQRDAAVRTEAAPRSAAAAADTSRAVADGSVRGRGAAATPATGDGAPAGPRRRNAPPVDVRPQAAPALVGAGSVDSSSAPGAAASGSLEQLFTGQTTTHDIGYVAPQAPRRRRVGPWIALAVVLVMIGGIVGGGFALWNTYGERVQAFLGGGEPLDYEAGQATGEARVTIVSGDTGESVSPKLFEAGVTKASNSLYKYMVDNNVAFTFQPGVYKLQQQMTSEAVLVALRQPDNRLDYSVQLREGLTMSQSLDLISEQLSLPRADLDAAVADPSQYGVSASSLEGWIFPATYDFDEGVTAQQVIDTMVTRTVQSLDAAGVPEGDRERILIIASIIEREARSSEDFYKVSRVIENRLQPSNQETFGKLEMDSTVQYGAGEMGSGSVSTSEEARNSDNPWNTYMYPGLPVGPIANSGDLAIDAAMHPADGPWLYFVTVNLDTGETVFTSTLSEHEKAVAQWQAWCADNPNSGC